MMRQMRENTKWIMLVTALAFVGLMVFEWGMDLTGRSSSDLSGGEIGRVNGQAITYEEFNQVYRNIYEQQQRALGNMPISNAINRQIEDAAFDQIVMQKLINEELRRRDLAASETEVRQAARYMPPPELMSDTTFWTNGEFDLNKYHAFLASPTLSPEDLLRLEQYYRESIPRSKLYYRTTAGTFVTDNELWRMWRDARDAVSVSYIQFDPARLAPEEAVTVSDAEISQYYREHRDDFIRPARASVKYVVIDRTPTAADSTAALERAQAIRSEIVGGSEFAEVAERESADSVSAAEGGRMEITRGQTVPAFDSVAFSLATGRISDPVRTQFGYHIVRVDSREDSTAVVRHVLIPIQRTEESENALFDRADSLEALAATMKLDQIGPELGLQVREVEMVPGLTILPGLQQAEDAEEWVFNDAIVGEVSELFETPRAYYAIELLEREDERTLTLEEASSTIREALAARKRLARAEERAREAVERLQGGASMDEVAREFGAETGQAGPFTRGDFVPELGRFTPVIGAAFGLKPGETSGAIASDRSVFIIRVETRSDADRAAWEAQKEEQRQRVVQNMTDQRWQQYLQALRENADVEDNRDQVLDQPAPVNALF